MLPVEVAKPWTVWKFPITSTRQQTVRMPAGAKILTVQVQRGIPCIWAVVDPDSPHENRSISVIGTGDPPCAIFGKYLGTFQMTNLNLVFHVFDNGRNAAPEDTPPWE